MRDRGIETLIHYPIPIPRQPALQSTSPAMCAVADRVCAQVVSLPMYPALSDAAVDRSGRGGRDFRPADRRLTQKPYT